MSLSKSTLTKTGRAAIALSISERPLHLAWGTGTLQNLINATELALEVGRRTPAVIAFVLPDDQGDIVIPQGLSAEGVVQEERYRQVDYQTPHLYIRVQFDYDDASNVSISEMGLFMDTVVDESLPPGQRYFTPAEITNKGLLMSVQMISPAINRSPNVRQSVEFVLQI